MSAAQFTTRRMTIVDARALPSYAFGHQSLMWWGTVGLMAIEGSVFALAAVIYFYVWTGVSPWPPATVAPPELRYGSLNTLVMLASLYPNWITKRAAEREDLNMVRAGVVACLAFALLFLGIRILEFRSLNCHWDSNAYASAVWLLLGLHTTHLLTDAYDTAVLGVLMFTGPLEGRRYVDVSENALYWYFVVASWLPIYAIIYFAPRFL